uniref:RRM domain-containing protein n=1 Tax=Aegilops tauschii subsp. strangulata TaxID=200361 RepID=A0A453CWN4_AEGTS
CHGKDHQGGIFKELQKTCSTTISGHHSREFNPVSANIVFEDRKSAGYGFVSFGTKEEAEAALTELNGKELMERPVILRWREDKETVKADGEVEDVKVNDQAEGVTVDDSGEVEGEDKQE